MSEREIERERESVCTRKRESERECVWEREACPPDGGGTTPNA